MTRLEYIIKEQGRQKGWICIKAGISRPTLTGLVKGTSKPSIEVALRIAFILEVTVEDLWGNLIDEWKKENDLL